MAKKIFKSDVTIEVMPDTDVEFEWSDVEKAIHEIKIDGLWWAPDFILQDFVFGLKKLITVCQIDNAKVEFTAPIVDQIKLIPGVGDAEMVGIETAAYDWNPPPKSKKNKKNKKKKAKKGEAVEITPELIKEQGDAIAAATAETDVYVADVNMLDNSGAQDVTVEQLKAVADVVAEKNAGLTFLLLAAGKTKVTGYAIVAPEHKEKITATEWIQTTTFKEASGDEVRASAEKVCDAAKEEFTLKIKDVISGEAFNTLTKKELIVEEEEETCYTFDDFE